MMHPFLSTLLVMGLLDYVWLGHIQRPWVQRKIAELNPSGEDLEHPAWTFLSVYLLMAGALYYFVIAKSKDKSAKQVIGEAALLGLAIYTTFDFTMLNLTSRWTMRDALMDIVWGTSMFALSAYLVHYSMTR